MSLLFASAALTAATMVPACSWNTPGRNPYRGTATEAVSRYIDIPAPTRARLTARIDAGTADDDVVITRNAILGRTAWQPAITDMHFGRRTVCERVTRERWPASAREPAKVYCADGYCLIVPRICGNISRIRTADSSGTGETGTEGGGGPGPGAGAPVFPHRPGALPEPGGAPEVDIPAADALAELATPAPMAAPPSLPARPFGDWTPGPGGRFANSPDALPGGPVPVHPVPEPAGWLMFATGVASLLVYTRFRK